MPMQNHTTDRAIRRALRARVCPECLVRPVGSGSLDDQTPRKCEGTCAIFANLNALKSVAQRTANDSLLHFERAIREGVCQQCTATPSAGDFCAERLACTCPLAVQSAKVLEVLEGLMLTLRAKSA